MKIAVVSYSYTGNNDRLATCVARDLLATHIKITTQKSVTIGSIMFDMLFNRTPKVRLNPNSLHKQYDLVLFCAPIWMGQIASPIRTYLHYLKSNPQSYGFFTVSGGADGENPKLFAELLKRTGAKPAIMLEQRIKDLIHHNSTPTRNDTSAYKISEAEANSLSKVVIKEINKFINLTN